MNIICPFHPKYKGLRPSKVDCWFCRSIYALMEALRGCHD